jgi:hypothetical protein
LEKTQKLVKVSFMKKNSASDFKEILSPAETEYQPMIRQFALKSAELTTRFFHLFGVEETLRTLQTLATQEKWKSLASHESPPTFLLFVNRKELIKEAYHKFLCGKMRQAFGYEGCPIFFITRERPKTIEPKRKPKSRKGTRKSTVKKFVTQRGELKEQVEGKARLYKKIVPRDATGRGRKLR